MTAPPPITSSAPTWWTPTGARTRPAATAWALNATCTNLVDEDPETRRGTISAGCPAGVYTLRASISDSGGGELASATAGFSVTEAPSEDATLRSLALSGVDIGAFDPATTTYAAGVANEVEETTITPTVNDDGATYVVNLDDVADEDGNVSLAVGEQRHQHPGHRRGRGDHR